MDGNENKKNGNPARTKSAAKRLEILARRRRIAKLYIRGETSAAEIARQLGICERQAKFDLQKIRQAWRESAIRSFDEEIEVENQRILKLIQQANDAYDKSTEPLEIVTVVKNSDGKLQSTTIKEEPRDEGDSRFLELVAKLSESRRKLLGLDQPARKEHQHAHGHAHFQLTVEQQQHTIAALSSALGIEGVIESPSSGKSEENFKANGSGHGDEGKNGAGPYPPDSDNPSNGLPKPPMQ